MHKTIFLLFAFSLFVLSSSAQKKMEIKPSIQPIKSTLANTSCDCKSAIKITISKSSKYGLTKSPNGFGNVMEISAKSKNDKNAFEEEHNSAWYELNIQHDGELIFDIVPQDSTNDYDFLLYKVNDTSFCTDILKKTAIPLRSNLSRNVEKTNGSTGLSSMAKNNFSEKGPGNNYSHSIQVKQGEKYMLVLDNVYPNGKGHTIYFSYMVQINIKGVVTDFTKNPISVEVSLMDEKNNCIAKTNSDSKVGSYNLTATVKENAFYSAIYYSPAYFPESDYINTRLLKPNENTLTINKMMAGLKVGETYNLTYFDDRQQCFLLYKEWPPLYLLANLMQKNPTMKIRVEIHSDTDESKWWWNEDLKYRARHDSTWNEIQRVHNVNFNRVPKMKNTLAEWRAFDFLLSLQFHDILNDRMEIVPSDKLAVLNAKTEEEKKKNRAITITILSK